jgi:hypothetical protein
MNPVRLFTDEDVYGAIAVELRRQGFDVVSTPEHNRRRESDDTQLQWATQNNRAILTFNVADFARLHRQIIGSGGHHYGIIVSSQLPVGEVLRRALRLMNGLDADTLCDRLEFLSDWQSQVDL